MMTAAFHMPIQVEHLTNLKDCEPDNLLIIKLTRSDTSTDSSSTKCPPPQHLLPSRINFATIMPSASSPVPVLLLKTKSSPTDAYEELFSRAPNNSHDTSFEPTFVPVLQHKFDEAGVDKLRNLLRQKRVGTSPDCEFGGLIFTSQRAVEAFAHVVREDKAANG